MTFPPSAAVAAIVGILMLGPASPAPTASALAPPSDVGYEARGAGGRSTTIDTSEAWIWPVVGAIRVTKPFRAPAHDYAAGHRGIDLRPDSPELRAPASGTVAFAGVVVDRPLITIDHGDGLVTTLEPVASDLSVGDAVSRGDPVGRLSSGGHSAPGTVHIGVRLDGEYVNPQLLLGGVARAVLLPCCEPR